MLRRSWMAGQKPRHCVGKECQVTAIWTLLSPGVSQKCLPKLKAIVQLAVSKQRTRVGSESRQVGTGYSEGPWRRSLCHLKRTPAGGKLHCQEPQSKWYWAIELCHSRQNPEDPQDLSAPAFKATNSRQGYSSFPMANTETFVSPS